MMLLLLAGAILSIAGVMLIGSSNPRLRGTGKALISASVAFWLAILVSRFLL